MVKAVVLILLFIVLFGLFRALYFLVSGKGDKHAVARNLTLRVAASIGVLVFLGFAKWMGWHEFNGARVQAKAPMVQMQGIEQKQP